MCTEKKAEIDFERQDTELGWYQRTDRMGIKGAPIWFNWLAWVLALGAFHYIFMKTSSVVVLVVIGISYFFLWFYFQGFFNQFEFKNVPLFNSPKRAGAVSIVLSGILATVSWWIALKVASAIAILQYGGGQ